MIELYDRERLLPRRDQTLWMASGLLMLGIALMGLRGWSLTQQRDALRLETARLTQTEALQQAQAAGSKAPTPAMLAELRRMVERLEADTALPAGAAAGLAPSQWLADLASVSAGQTSIVKAEIGRSGAAAIEAQARNAEAVSDYMQAWEQHPNLRRLAARGLEIREDPREPGLLRFTLRTDHAAAPEPARMPEAAP